MATILHRIPPDPTALRTIQIGGLMLAGAICALAVPAHAATDGGLLAGEPTLSESELAALRGGFFTADGLELSFGFRLDLDIDDRLALSMQFNPIPAPFGEDGLEIEAPFGPEGLKIDLGAVARPEPAAPAQPVTAERRPESAAPILGAVNLPGESRKAKVATEAPQVASLGLTDGGGVEVLGGNPEVSAIADGTRYTFANDLVADVVETTDGVILKTGGGDLPVAVTKGSDGIDLKVGDERSTLVTNRISPKGIDSKVANRKHGRKIDHRLTFDVNVLNFSAVDATRKVYRNGRRLQGLVDRGIVGMLNPR